MFRRLGVNNKDLINRVVKKHALMAVVFSALAVASGFMSVYLSAFLFFLLRTLNLSGYVFNIVFTRRTELKADSVANKYGYGDDLISAIKKIEKSIEKKRGDKCGTICKFVKKAGDIINESDC